MGIQNGGEVKRLLHNLACGFQNIVVIGDAIVESKCELESVRWMIEVRL